MSETYSNELATKLGSKALARICSRKSGSAWEGQVYNASERYKSTSSSQELLKSGKGRCLVNVGGPDA